MSWIQEISYDNSEGALRKIYDRIKGPDNNVDNILTAQSLRPHTLTGHMALYKNVLHNTNNSLPKWYLETLGVYVSFLNNCDYCVQHHFAGLERLLNDTNKSNQILNSIKNDSLEVCLEEKYYSGSQYALHLTRQPNSIKEETIDSLRSAGLSDGEILEINQVVSYFNYANRTVLGLGVNTEGDIIGLSPRDSSDPENWSHS